MQPDDQVPEKQAHTREQGEQLADDDQLRATYRQLRYQGPAPVWQPQAVSPFRLGLPWLPAAAIAAAAVLIASVGWWWLWSDQLRPAKGASELVIADADVTDLLLESVGDATDPAVMVRPEVDLEPAGARVELEVSGPSVVREATGSASDAPLANPQAFAAEPLDDPTAISSELIRLRGELQELRGSGSLVPVAPRGLHFRVPKAPTSRLSTGAPPKPPGGVYDSGEGAARD